MGQCDERLFLKLVYRDHANSLQTFVRFVNNPLTPKFNSACQPPSGAFLIRPSKRSNFNPESHLVSRCEHGRRRVGVRAVTPAGRRLDRDLPVTAEIAVADPDAAVRRRVAVPGDLDRRPAAPPQARAVGVTARQEELAALPLREAHEPRTDIDLHPRLVPKERMRAPVARDLSRAGI